ncbi:hypothetical protein ACFRMQ_19415 [Kitasatospora sp. NPDC056783]|uniref:hypothetical protein n=1 Tax=Kitasatospora sp. NPDC056783 TaxID=3345943 RepID=UPI00368028FF
MRHLIVTLIRRALVLCLPARGQHRAVPAPAAPVPAPAPEPSTPAPYEPTPEPDRLSTGPLVRPYIDHDAWRAELDDMQRDYNERQRQRERREALRAVGEGRPDTGYTYPGAHTLAGAVA